MAYDQATFEKEVEAVAEQLLGAGIVHEPVRLAQELVRAAITARGETPPVRHLKMTADTGFLRAKV